MVYDISLNILATCANEYVKQKKSMMYCAKCHVELLMCMREFYAICQRLCSFMNIFVLQENNLKG